MEGTREDHGKLESGYRSPDRDSNPGPFGYEVRVIPISHDVKFVVSVL
jgi:hypothetical protein